MDQYEGPAAVRAAGRDIEVVATLWRRTERLNVAGQSVPGLSEWGGTLAIPDGQDAWDIHQDDSPRLLVDGREGGFIPTGGSLGAGGLLDIAGSGPAPFGDEG
ncbi:hypothetical protein AB0F46_29655 [Streptomyces sp. NPDC026665]|uniref:hypothetical protein n=1 Tax=Streptomyces sp. NPDC026665 TaxID=3154798 RepID=UPI00340F7B72